MLRRNFFAAIAAPILTKFIPDGKNFPHQEKAHLLVTYEVDIPDEKNFYFSLNIGEDYVCIPRFKSDNISDQIERMKPYGKILHLVKFPEKNSYGLGAMPYPETMSPKLESIKWVKKVYSEII